MSEPPIYPIHRIKPSTQCPPNILPNDPRVNSPSVTRVVEDAQGSESECGGDSSADQREVGVDAEGEDGDWIVAGGSCASAHLRLS